MGSEVFSAGASMGTMPKKTMVSTYDTKSTLTSLKTYNRLKRIIFGQR